MGDLLFFLLNIIKSASFFTYIRTSKLFFLSLVFVLCIIVVTSSPPVYLSNYKGHKENTIQKVFMRKSRFHV